MGLAWPTPPACLGGLKQTLWRLEQENVLTLLRGLFSCGHQQASPALRSRSAFQPQELRAAAEGPEGGDPGQDELQDMHLKFWLLQTDFSSSPGTDAQQLKKSRCST